MIITDIVIITSIMVRLSPSHYFLVKQQTWAHRERRKGPRFELISFEQCRFIYWWNEIVEKGHNEKLGKRPFEDKFWRALEDVAKNHKQMVVVAILFKKWVKNMFGQWKIACCFSPLSKEREVRKEILCSNRNGGTMRALTRPAVCKKGMLEEVEKSCLCKKARNYRARM